MLWADRTSWCQQVVLTGTSARSAHTKTGKSHVRQWEEGQKGEGVVGQAQEETIGSFPTWAA